MNSRSALDSESVVSLTNGMRRSDSFRDSKLMIFSDSCPGSLSHHYTELALVFEDGPLKCQVDCLVPLF
ncbi:hypothetical protein TSMEX_008093 [Taenia solium]|eukprot:TsM_000282500 transcript=TsM_000282500 gene=TsM_000282500